MPKAIRWVLMSSANAEKIALTLKAGVPFLLLLGAENFVSGLEIDTAIGSVSNILVSAGEIVTGVLTLYGFLRKLVHTFTRLRMR